MNELGAKRLSGLKRAGLKSTKALQGRADRGDLFGCLAGDLMLREAAFRVKIRASGTAGLDHRADHGSWVGSNRSEPLIRVPA